MGFKPTTIVNNDHIHPRICNEALKEYTSLGFKTRYNKKDPIGLLVMIGCGLGYQIKEIIKNNTIRNLLIFDENKDSFFASLFTVDWEEIISDFNKRGGKVKLHIGKNLNDTLLQIRNLPSEIGLYNMVTSYIYLHTESNVNKEFYKKFQDEFYLYGSSLGFLTMNKLLCHIRLTASTTITLF